MDKMKVHYSSESNEWATPQLFFDGLNEKFKFTLDPSCTEKTAKCKKFYTQADDGLSKDWGNEIVFCNPPYGREIGKWVKKAYEESLKGSVVVLLIPSRTDTAWWHDYVKKGMVHFIRGRMKFVQAGREGIAAPFPSCLVLFISTTIWTWEQRNQYAYNLSCFANEYNTNRKNKI